MQRLRRTLGLLRPLQLRLRRWPCPCCGGAWHLRLADRDIAIRCLRCGASPITQSIVAVLAGMQQPGAHARVLELSGQGRLARWLEQRADEVALTCYRPDQPFGVILDGLRNEDVQRLTLESESFDLCTSTEVFEHVADDAAGFAELYRVLRPGGRLVFTVPLTGQRATVERASLEHGQLVHHLEPEYHADPWADSDRVLCFRNYGDDILDRVAAAGFHDVRFQHPAWSMFGHARRVITARR